GPLRAAAAGGREKEFKEAAFAWLDGETDTLDGIEVSDADKSKIRRQWKLRPDEERQLLSDLLVRFDLPSDQMQRIIGEDRADNGLDVSLSEIADNPYLLTESFVGNDLDDIISFS